MIYIARDNDEKLTIFSGKPIWEDAFQGWGPSNDQGQMQIPRKWFPEVSPGECWTLNIGTPIDKKGE